MPRDGPRACSRRRPPCALASGRRLALGWCAPTCARRRALAVPWCSSTRCAGATSTPAWVTSSRAAMTSGGSRSFRGVSSPSSRTARSRRGVEEQLLELDWRAYVGVASRASARASPRVRGSVWRRCLAAESGRVAAEENADRAWARWRPPSMRFSSGSPAWSSASSSMSRARRCPASASPQPSGLVACVREMTPWAAGRRAGTDSSSFSRDSPSCSL